MSALQLRQQNMFFPPGSESGQTASPPRYYGGRPEDVIMQDEAKLSAADAKTLGSERS